MDERTLETLKGSIAKWEAIVAGTGENLGSENCPLCKAFPECWGCPVMEKTGQDSCYGTPYYSFNRTLGFGERTAVTAIQKQAAQAELDFLCSLMPKEAAS